MNLDDLPNIDPDVPANWTRIIHDVASRIIEDVIWDTRPPNTIKITDNLGDIIDEIRKKHGDVIPDLEDNTFAPISKIQTVADMPNGGR